jgi:hypothetical protein
MKNDSSTHNNYFFKNQKNKTARNTIIGTHKEKISRLRTACFEIPRIWGKRHTIPINFTLEKPTRLNIWDSQ